MCTHRGAKEMIQNMSTSIPYDPASIIAHFALLLDEDINDDFFQDEIESIVHHYNSQYPRDNAVTISIVHTAYFLYINNVL